MLCRIVSCLALGAFSIAQGGNNIVISIQLDGPAMQFRGWPWIFPHIQPPWDISGNGYNTKLIFNALILAWRNPSILQHLQFSQEVDRQILSPHPSYSWTIFICLGQHKIWLSHSNGMECGFGLRDIWAKKVCQLLRTVMAECPQNRAPAGPHCSSVCWTRPLPAWNYHYAPGTRNPNIGLFEVALTGLTLQEEER